MNDLLVVDQANILRGDQNPALVYIASLAPGGKVTMRGALNKISNMLAGVDMEIFPWHQLRFSHTQAIRAKLQETLKPATVNKIISALRGVLKAAWQLDLMTAEDYHKAASIKGVRGSTLPSGRELAFGEITAVIGVCENEHSIIGDRDAAIVAVLYGGGLRRAEIVALQLSDWNSEMATLLVQGKGNKERKVYLKNGGGRAIAAWLKTRGDFKGALFVPVHKGGNIHNKHMSSQSVYDMVKRRGVQAGIPDFSPHDLRRSHVGALLGKGVDISLVSKMVGHSNVQTTARYDHRPETAKAKAAELIHVPFRGG